MWGSETLGAGQLFSFSLTEAAAPFAIFEGCAPRTYATSDSAWIYRVASVFHLSGHLFIVAYLFEDFERRSRRFFVLRIRRR